MAIYLLGYIQSEREHKGRTRAGIKEAARASSIKADPVPWTEGADASAANLSSPTVLVTRSGVGRARERPAGEPRARINLSGRTISSPPPVFSCSARGHRDRQPFSAARGAEVDARDCQETRARKRVVGREPGGGRGDDQSRLGGAMHDMAASEPPSSSSTLAAAGVRSPERHIDLGATAASTQWWAPPPDSASGGSTKKRRAHSACCCRRLLCSGCLALPHICRSLESVEERWDEERVTAPPPTGPLSPVALSGWLAVSRPCRVTPWVRSPRDVTAFAFIGRVPRIGSASGALARNLRGFF
jgi:hypothetical protein